MFLLWWLSAGVTAGWILVVVVSNAPPAGRASILPAPPANDVAEMRLWGTVVACLALAILAAFTDNSLLSNSLLTVKSFFIGVRMQALLTGALFGALIRWQWKRIYRAANRAFSAVLGEQKNPAWALQSAVALGIIAAVAIIVRPDLLSYLRSFKLGSFEATFADHEPILSLRQAHLNLRDFREQVALQQYENFEESFLSEGNVRGWARVMMMDEDLREQTTQITRRFATYVDPVIDALTCLREVNAVRVAPHDYDLVAYAAIWENFLLSVHAGKDVFRPESEGAADSAAKAGAVAQPKQDAGVSIQKMLGGLVTHFKNVQGHANEFNVGCTARKSNARSAKIKPEEERKSNPEADGAEISKHYKKAAEILRRKGYDAPDVVALVVIEPYFTGAVSDLIALISGDREKSDFLTKMTHGFPLDDALVSPGLVNLYYQATDASLNAPGPIPLDDVRGMIEFAVRGADLTKSRSAERLSRLRDRANPQGLPTSCAATANSVSTSSSADGHKALDDVEKVIQIYDIFLRNVFATLTAETDVYVQRVLEGENIPADHRQSWIAAVGRLSSMLQARIGAPPIDLGASTSGSLDELTKQRLGLETWTSCESRPASAQSMSETDDPEESDSRSRYIIDPEFMLQADLAVALSAVLLSADEPSSQSCNAAQFYTNNAATWIEPSAKHYRLDQAQKQRLKQLITGVSAYASERCTSGRH